MKQHEQGTVVNVFETTIGDELAVDAPPGSTSITLVDAVDFDEEGGTALVADELVTYDSADLDTDTLALSAPLAGSYLAGDSVLVQPASYERTAVVELDEGDGEAIDARVPHALYDRIPEGTRDVSESVSLVLDGGEWVIEDIIGQQPLVDGSFIDVDTLPAPETSDGDAPPVVTGITTQGGIGTIFVKWEAVDNPDPVTYRVHAAAAAPVAIDASTLVGEIAGTLIVARKMPDGTSIPTDVDTHFVVVAHDADGDGPTSADITGRALLVTGPDIAANSITGDKVVANSITTAELAADSVTANELAADAIDGKTITGATIQTRADEDRGIKIGKVAGATDYDEAAIVFDETGKPFLKAVPGEGMAVIAGQLTATTETVEQGASLGGVTEIVRHPDGSPGVLRLTGFTTAPKNAPTVTPGYDSVQFADDGLWADRVGLAFDGTHYFTLNTSAEVIEKWTPAGMKVDEHFRSLEPDAAEPSITCGGGKVHVLTPTLDGFAWAVSRYDAATLAFEKVSEWNDFIGQRAAALGYDSTTSELLIAQSSTSDDKVRIRRYTHPPGLQFDPLVPSATAVVTTDAAWVANLRGILHGSFDFGSTRFVVANVGTADVRTATAAGVLQSGEYFPPGGDKVGVAHNGANFVTLDKTGLMRVHTGIVGTTAQLTKWVSNTLANATNETDQSPRAKIILPRRSKLNWSRGEINTGGTNAPDRFRVYVGSGMTDPGRAAMWRQTDPAVGATSGAYSSLVASGDNPLAVNGFKTAAGTVQEIQLTDETTFLDGNGSGDASTTYVPTFTSITTPLTAASFTIAGRYARLGRRHIAFSVVINCVATTGFGTGAYEIGLPVAAQSFRGVGGTARQITPNRFYFAAGFGNTTIRLWLPDFSAADSVSTGMTNGTELRIVGSYEAAS